MAELLNVSFEDRKGIIEGRLDNLFDVFKAKQLLKEAVDDIADKIEDQAKIEAPQGPTGRLKAHPVDRSDTKVDITPERFDEGFGQLTGIPLFGGGFAVRGPGGRFVKPEAFRPSIFSPGEIIIQSILSIPKDPAHAIWVHDGTGVYEPGGSGKMITAHDPEGFMTFPASRWPTANFKRKNYRFKSVLGQPANPYLDRAFFTINGSYVPARIEILRGEIAALT